MIILNVSFVKIFYHKDILVYDSILKILSIKLLMNFNLLNNLTKISCI